MLDFAGERELPVHLLLFRGLRHQPRVLDLRGSHVRERRQETQVRFLEGAMAHLAVDVNEPDHLAFVLERRGQDRLDPREADRVGERDARAGRRVHQDQPVPLLDDLSDEGLRQPDVVGRHPLRDPDDRRDQLVRQSGAEQDHAPVRHESFEHLVHQELHQFVDGDVAQELDRELVDDSERLDQL